MEVMDKDNLVEKVKAKARRLEQRAKHLEEAQDALKHLTDCGPADSYPLIMSGQMKLGGYSGGDIVTIKCPNCKHQWKVELPQ